MGLRVCLITKHHCVALHLNNRKALTSLVGISLSHHMEANLTHHTKWQISAPLNSEAAFSGAIRNVAYRAPVFVKRSLVFEKDEHDRRWAKCVHIYLFVSSSHPNSFYRHQDDRDYSRFHLSAKHPRAWTKRLVGGREGGAIYSAPTVRSQYQTLELLLTCNCIASP